MVTKRFENMNDGKFGTGIDIIEVERIDRLIEKFGDKFLQRLFTRAEIEYCRSKKNRGQHFAARFAAKEAVVKATSPWVNLQYRQVEVLREKGGSPVIKVHGDTGLREDRLAVSMTHTHNFAAATAIYDPSGSRD